MAKHRITLTIIAPSDSDCAVMEECARRVRQAVQDCLPLGIVVQLSEAKRLQPRDGPGLSHIKFMEARRA